MAKKKGRKSMFSKSSKPKDTINMTKVSKLVSKSIHRSIILSKVEEEDGSECIKAAEALAKS